MKKNEKFVITINREVGTGGRTVGRKLAEKLGVNYYDKAIVEGLTKKFGLSIERIEEIKAEKKSWWNDIFSYYKTLADNAELPKEAQAIFDNADMFKAEKRILEELAEQGSCVVAGRTGFMVFREWPNRLNIFIQASMDYRDAAPERQREGGTRHHRKDGHQPRDLHQEVREDLALRHPQLSACPLHGRPERGRGRRGHHGLYRPYQQVNRRLTVNGNTQSRGLNKAPLTLWNLFHCLPQIPSSKSQTHKMIISNRFHRFACRRTDFYH